MTKSDVFLALCLCFVFGVGINSLFLNFDFLLFLPEYFYIPAFFVNIFIFLKNRRIGIIFFGILFFLIGAFVFEKSLFLARNNFLNDFAEKNKSVEIRGIVCNETFNDESENNAIVCVSEIKNGNKRAVGNFGKINIISQQKDLIYGDQVEIWGSINVINNFNDFDYKMFLAKDRIYASSYYPRVEIIKRNKGNFLMSWVISSRKFFREKISYFFKGEQFSIMSSLMLGDKYVLSKEIKEKLKISGLSHIIAISGMHISIFAQIIISMFLFFGFYKKHAVFFALGFTVFFIFLSGFQVSALRAGIMGGIYMLSQIIKRQSFFLHNLVFALTMILAFNPLLLRYDIGLQLSFASILGIFYHSPFLKEKLKFIPDTGFLDIRAVLAMTISAQVWTFPIIMWNFKEFYPLGVLANILIVPFASYLMISGLFLIIFSSFWTQIGYIFYFPSLAFVSYFQWVLDFFKKFKEIFIVVEINAFFIFVFYIFLGYTIYKIENHKKDFLFEK